MDAFKSMVQEMEKTKPIARSNRTFYVDDDVYEWMRVKFGGNRDMSNFVRTVLRKCMDAETNGASND